MIKRSAFEEVFDFVRGYVLFAGEVGTIGNVFCVS